MSTDDPRRAEGREGRDDRPPDPERDPAYTRRQILRTAAAATVTAAAAAFLYERHPGGSSPGRTEDLPRVPDHRVQAQGDASKMAIVRGPDAGENVRRAIEAIGGIQAFVGRGESVVIKPNVGWNRMPEQAANTNPEVVAAVITAVKGAGASKIWVFDVPVNNAERCFARSGIEEAARAAGATVLIPGSDDFRPVRVGGATLNTAQVFWALLEADRVINVPVVKHHGLTGATLAMKNWYGVLGGHRTLLHQDIHRSVVDLAMMVKPTFTVLDGTRVLMANGPSGGSLDDVKTMNVVAASRDEVAIDAFGATLLGRHARDLAFIGLAEQKGLGTSDYRSLDPVEIGS
jgi:uncharacterized protein (DUF362 family)